MNKTVDYYNNNAEAFYHRTIAADISKSYQAFLKYLPSNAHILDAGCGVGRDTKYFISQSYKVTAFDASFQMVELDSRETNLEVLQLNFQALEFDQQFEGVWAQASLLHVPYHETKKVYKVIHRALKADGIFYASYKYGKDYMATPERDFWNMDESTILPYLSELFDVKEIWTEKDTRSKVAPSQDGMWLNFIAKKI